MRIGVHLPQFRAPASGADVARAAREAEEAGVDDVWVSDHIVLPAGGASPPEYFHDALTVLTWAAAVTTRVGLGTSVLVLPYRDPVVLARAVASLDALSDGRVVLGVASGWMEREFAALGVPFRGRGPRTDRAIDLMRALWRGEDPPGEPALAGMRVTPRPARPGGPPLWVGGNSEAGVRRAALRGDAWHTTLGVERLPDRIAALRRTAAAAGREPEAVTVSVRARVDAAGARELVPRLRDMGVSHLLVDLPHLDPARIGPDAAEVVRAAC